MGCHNQAIVSDKILKNCSIHRVVGMEEVISWTQDIISSTARCHKIIVEGLALRVFGVGDVIRWR